MKIEEFMAKLDHMAKTFPTESEAALETGARRMRKALVENSPIGKNQNSKQRISKNWKVSYDYRGNESVAKIRNTSPHYHLVERGHKIVDSKGNAKGFRQGTFFTKHTINTEGPIIKTLMAKKFYRLVKDKL
ncbi:HK97 gp10 family phage protein [Veillonella sp.]|uniref:HK97 gp10 family phage protein n=1 Tax=Veillonella sp. TaxID=1926307 RepID=UPI0025D8D0F2|nr:HK97 gp10 family phage protein [Veillonella sp.]